MIVPEVRCVELVEVVTEWMEGGLDDVTRAQVEEHLVVCTPCSAYVAQIRQAVAVLRDLQSEAPPVATRDERLRLFRAHRST